MSTIDEIRQRRRERLGYDPDDPFDQEAARREHRGQQRRHDAEDRANVTAGHKAGVEEERERQQRSKRRPAGRDTSRRRRTTTRRRGPARRVARQVVRPLRSQVSGFTQTFGMVIAVIALYQLLTAAPQVSGALDLITRGFRWLADPGTVVLPSKEH